MVIFFVAKYNLGEQFGGKRDSDLSIQNNNLQLSTGEVSLKMVLL
jgi:hypothetical protein